MEFTKEQYELMGRLRNGLIWDNLSEQEREIINFLDSEKLVQWKVYIADGYMELSQKGQCAYERFQKSRQQAAESAADNRKEHRFQVYLAVFSAMLGAIVSNFDRVVGLIYQLSNPR